MFRTIVGAILFVFIGIPLILGLLGLIFKGVKNWLTNIKRKEVLIDWAKTFVIILLIVAVVRIFDHRPL